MSKLLRTYTNEHSRFMVVNGALLHYRDEGEGEPLLLLHGAFSSLHTFDGWVDKLKDKYRILRLDLPGFGLSDVPLNHSFTIRTYIQIISVFLDRLDIETCHVAGSSLGGWLAWEFALKYKAHVNRLILIDAAGFLDDQSIPLPFKMARVPFVNRVLRFAVQPSVFELFLRQIYGDPKKLTKAVIDRYYQLFSQEGKPEAFLSMANARYKDNTLHLRELPHETLVMWGRKDTWLPIENAYKFQRRIPEAELIIYEELGHIPMEEDPHETALDLWAFLSRPVYAVKK